MTLPTSKEFKILIKNENPDEINRKYIFSGDSYVFKERPDRQFILKNEVFKSLEIKVENIFIVGSAKIGFSLAPDNFAIPFDKYNSDIDLVLIDENKFDEIWFTLLNWYYPLPNEKIPPSDYKWLIDTKKKLYKGWFEPHTFKSKYNHNPVLMNPLREYRIKWFNALRKINAIPELSFNKVNGRLYRSFEHVLYYHNNGIKELLKRGSDEV